MAYQNKNGNQLKSHRILRKITGRVIKQIVIIEQTNFHFLRITYKSISLQRNVVLGTARLEVRAYGSVIKENVKLSNYLIM
jgi:hypothetical protein